MEVPLSPKSAPSLVSAWPYTTQRPPFKVHAVVPTVTSVGCWPVPAAVRRIKIKAHTRPSSSSDPLGHTQRKDLKEVADSELDGLAAEYQDTDPKRIVSTVRDCGVSFAMALTHVMEGVLDLKPDMTLEDELKEFYCYHQAS